MAYEYRSMIAPTKYFQGKGLLAHVYERTCHLGKNFAFLVDDITCEIIKDKVEKAFEGTDGTFMFIKHHGESTVAEAERIAEILRENNIDVICGCGGGKVMDSAKRAAMEIDTMKVVIVPTSAASDAPCSANTCEYDENGKFIRAIHPKENPSVVLVDTEIIANAPVRLLVAGMGDAFVTYFEARASRNAEKPNLSGGGCTQAGFAIAELCKESLLKYGALAKADVEKKQWSEYVDLIAETNIYLSGLGFENNGCSLSHATYNGLTAAIPHYPKMHGEGVAFGLFVQLAVEYLEAGQWNDEEWNEVVDFYKSVGLPTKFEDVAVTDTSDEFLESLANYIFVSSGNSTREPFEVTPEKIFAALKHIREMDI